MPLWVAEPVPWCGDVPCGVVPLGPEPLGAEADPAEAEPLGAEAEPLEAEPLGAEAEPLGEAEPPGAVPVDGAEPSEAEPLGGVAAPGPEPLGGVVPRGGAPDGRSDCIAARTLAADRPSSLASAVAGSVAEPLGAWPGVPLGRVLSIAEHSLDSVTPSFVASALRSKPTGPGWAVAADAFWLVPDESLFCELAAPPQPAAPSAADAPTITASLRIFGFTGASLRR
jgi:hypothetical protein